LRKKLFYAKKVTKLPDQLVVYSPTSFHRIVKKFQTKSNTGQFFELFEKSSKKVILL
jgi:hypothetical protein